MVKLTRQITAAFIVPALYLAACSNTDIPTLDDAKQAYEEHRYAAARAHLARIIGEGEVDHQTRLLYVQVMLKLGHGDAAEASLQRIPYTYLKAEERRVLLAHSLVLKNQPEQAISLLEKSEKLSEKEAWLNLWAHRDTGLLQAKPELLMSTIEQFPESADILTLGGEHMLVQRKTHMAVRFARKAVKVAPDHFGALMLSGRVAVEGNDLQSAHGYYSKLWKQYPESPLALATLIGLELDMDRLDSAGKRLKHGLIKFDSFALMKFQKARFEFAKERYTAARQWLDEAQALLGDYAPAFALSAKIAIKLGREQIARIEVEKALAIDPENRMAFLALHDLDAAEKPNSAKP